ncbi:MAG TPA: hypothetical protein VMA09_22185 [Candidatus Binataceae bacterium]|nr:hypothetical protein [Candidatus Binataceae bacterium]
MPSFGLRFLWSFIPVLGTMLHGVTISIGAAYWGLLHVLYYFDRRCRVEDFDIRFLAEQVSSEIPPVAVSDAS